MVYCVQLRAAFSTAARRDAVLADMQARIEGKQRWSVDVLGPGSFRFGVNGIVADLRFVSQLDADDLKARVEGFATGVRAPLAGSSLTVHDCTHDEGGNACTNVVRREW